MRKLTQLPSQNADLYLIRRVLDQLSCLVDALEVERRQNALQDERLSNHDSRLTELEEKYQEMMEMLYGQQTQLEEYQESTDFAVNEVRYLTHLVAEKEDLESQLSFYCPPD
jgi:predicted  nucleic acid-binding Zn-ribbon protein